MTPRLALAVTLAASAYAQGWQAELAAAPTGSVVFQGASYASSSTLRVTWAAPPGVAVNYYLIRAEQENPHRVRARAEGDAVELVLTGLKSATTYEVRLRACLDASCESAL